MKQEKKQPGKLKMLAGYYKPYRGLFFADLFFAFLGAAVTLVIPLMVRYIMNSVSELSAVEAKTIILKIGVGMLLLILAVHMLVWQIVLALIPDIRQALGAEISTWDFVLSQGSGNAALLIWMLANALWTQRQTPLRLLPGREGYRHAQRRHRPHHRAGQADDGVSGGPSRRRGGEHRLRAGYPVLSDDGVPPLV